MSTCRPGAWPIRSVTGLFVAAPEPADDEVRKRLEDILSRPEFAPEPENWLYRFFAWLAKMFQSLGTLQDTAPVFFWILLVGCVVLLVLLLGHIGWTIKRGVFASSLEAVDPVKAQRALLSLRYWEEAGLCAAHRQYTDAIRCLFLSLVYRFDESGRVNFQHAYTNREYLTLFRDRPAVYDNLKVFVDILDDYWYAQRPTDQGQYEHCLALYQGLDRP